jgi:hypothetical protein
VSEDDARVAPPEDVPPVSAEVLGGPPTDEPRRYPSTIGGGLFLLVLAAMVTGILIAMQDWRSGVRVVGGALAFAGLVRLVLPQKDAGMLAVRHRSLDVLILAVFAAGLFFLASSIPPQPL